MTTKRTSELKRKLERGLMKSQEILDRLRPEQWNDPVFTDSDSWNVKQLVAHFVSAEENLLNIAVDIATGGPGSPEGIEIDDFNADEMERMQGLGADKLQKMLAGVRKSTIAWLQEQDDQILELMGNHPTLGNTNIDTVIFSIYAHQLLHMREVLPNLRNT